LHYTKSELETYVPGYDWSRGNCDEIQQALVYNDNRNNLYLC